jgi:hypothetical protein
MNYVRRILTATLILSALASPAFAKGGHSAHAIRTSTAKVHHTETHTIKEYQPYETPRAYVGPHMIRSHR